MATFVMAFGISTSIVVLQMGFKAVDVARGNTLASQVLQSEMESLRLMSWGGMQALPAEQTYETTAFTTPEGERIATRFPITRTISNLGSSRDNEMLQITLEVTWQSYDGRSHTRRFHSYYSKDGLYDYYYTLAGGV